MAEKNICIKFSGVTNPIASAEFSRVAALAFQLSRPRIEFSETNSKEIQKQSAPSLQINLFYEKLPTPNTT